MEVDDYLGLVTSEHADKPLFMAVIAALAAGPVAQQKQMAKMPADFDLDAAVGKQLDAVGAWAGISRNLLTPITGIYFSWDGPANLGWDSGSWQGPYDPTTGITQLPDDAYRTLIRAKIAANSWDGTISGAQAIWDQVFKGQQQIILQDRQDMSMVVGFVGPPLDAIQRALLTGGYFPLKPEAVAIAYYAIPVNTGPIFAWDASSPQLSGWGTGSWTQETNPA